MYKLTVLIAALKQQKKINMFLWNQFVNEVVLETEQKFEIHTKKSKRRAAAFVGPDLPGEQLARDEFSIKEFEPPMIKPFRTARANDIFEQKFGQTIYGETVNSEDAALDELTKELGELDDSITRKEIVMLAELLTTGKMEIKGKGVNREAITYGADAENFETLTGTDAWNNADSDPIADIERWRDTILKKTGVLIDSIILTTKAKTAFMNHEKVKERLKYTTADVLRIQPRALGNGAAFHGTIPELEVDIYSFTEWYIDEEGNEVSLLPDGGVIAYKQKCINVHYGAIAQIAEGKRQKFVGDRVPKHWVDEDSDIEKIRLSASPLPVPDDADCIIFSNVIEEVA